MTKRKQTENYTFLLDNSSVKLKKYKYAERNMLGYLCFKHIYYTEYRAENDGFFFVTSEEIQKAVGISKNTVTVYAVKFVTDGLIDYISGKKHNPSKYRLLFQFDEVDIHHTDTEEIIDTFGNQELVTSQKQAENADSKELTGISGNKNKELRIKNKECTYSYSDCTLEKDTSFVGEVEACGVKQYILDHICDGNVMGDLLEAAIELKWFTCDIQVQRVVEQTNKNCDIVQLDQKFYIELFNDLQNKADRERIMNI